MASIFDLINNYQDQIIASVTIALGAIQAGVSSWAIHRLVLDEHFLIFMIGHAMYKKTKSIQEALENYSAVKEYLRYGVFDTLNIVKAAFSLALVAGVCQILVSLLMLCLRKKPKVTRILWLAVGFLSISALASSFVILWMYWVPNVLYFQISLSSIGVNFFVMLHLLASIAPSVFIDMFRKSEQGTAGVKSDMTNGSRRSTKLGTSTTSTSTTSLVHSISLHPESPDLTQLGNVSGTPVSVQLPVQVEELPLPLPPPPPSSRN